jgi:hypothetical protein
VTPELGKHGRDTAYRFADSHVDSFAAWDLLVFLHHRPETAEAPSGFATLLGRKEDDLVVALDHLTSTGAVRRVEEEDSSRYCLSKNAQLREDLGAFVELCAIKECRLEIVRRVLASYT